ncbi:MAG: ABC transporter permease [Schleiferiaceae bacterium]|jgi:peptide/nickel transport system permease protein
MKRAGRALLVLWGVATLVFFLFHAVGGDPARMMLGQVEDEQALAAVRAAYGLDQPLWVQYGRYLGGISPVRPVDGVWGLHWPDLQTSYQQRGVPVAALIGQTLPNTALLALVSLAAAVLIGVPLGLFSALRAGTWADRLVTVLSTVGMATPSFFSAIVVAWIFAYLLHDWTGLPLNGSLRELDDYGTAVRWEWSHLVLPALTLAVRPVGVIAQMMRSSALEILSLDYVRTAYAKGLSTAQVLRRHVLRNALNPLITTISGWFASLLAGAVFVETVFGWRGAGKLMVDALEGRDFPVVMGAILALSLVFVVLQAVVDWLYRVVDPRIR